MRRERVAPQHVAMLDRQPASSPCVHHRVRVATSTYVTAGLAVTVIAGLAIAFAIWIHDAPPKPQLVITAPDVGFEIEPSSSSVMRDSPPPPEGPFYASLFVAGATWTLPCRFLDKPVGAQRCRVQSVEVSGATATARIGCWFVHDGDTPNPAVNTYVMTPAGLFKAETTPTSHGEPIFTPHPVAKALPRGWGQEEPRGPTWAHAMIRHHGAWCAVDEFQSEDTSAEFAECISPHGIVGLTQRFNIGPTEYCGDVPDGHADQTP